MKFKCENCGNSEKFVETGKVSGYYETWFNGDGDYMETSNILETIEYHPHKKLRCAKCNKIIGRN